MVGWFSDIASLAGPIASIAGNLISADANERAADKVSESQRYSADILSRALQQGAATRAGGLDRASGMYRQIAEETTPARGRLRSIVARPEYALTPEQAIHFEDQMRDVNARLARGGLRGAGRAGVGLANEASRRLRAGFAADNRTAADRAANVLNEDFRRATFAQPAVATERADVLARGEEGAGRAASGAEAIAGATGAQAGLSSTRNIGAAIGGIGSIIANDGKRSRYGNDYNYDLYSSGGSAAP